MAETTSVNRRVPTDGQLAVVFNRRFGAAYNVRCLGGFEEPEYRPPQSNDVPAQLRYTRNYPASVLHEIAHWCIAGRHRLALVDFGYTYKPPPRTAEQQQRFFALELKVQCLEAWFALGTGVRFVASADNLDCDAAELDRFTSNIAQRLAGCSETQLPYRAQAFTQALSDSGLGVWPVAKSGASVCLSR